MQKVLTIHNLIGRQAVNFLNDEDCRLVAMNNAELIDMLLKPHLEEYEHRYIDREELNRYYCCDDPSKSDYNNALNAFITYAFHGRNQPNAKDYNNFHLLWRMASVSTIN